MLPPLAPLLLLALLNPTARSGSRSRTSRLLCSLPPLPPSSRSSLPLPALALAARTCRVLPPAACTASDRSRGSIPTHPPLVPLRISRSPPTARPTAPLSACRPHSPALTRTDHSLMRADDMQACNCWVEDIRIAAASADKLLLSADKLLLSHVSLRRRVQAQPRLAPIPAHRPVSQPRATNDRARSRRSRSCGSRSQGPSSTAPPCSSCSTSSRTSWFQSPAATSPSALSRRTHPPSLRSFRLLSRRSLYAPAARSCRTVPRRGPTSTLKLVWPG